MSASSMGEMVIQDVLMGSPVKDAPTVSCAELRTASPGPTSAEAFWSLDQSRDVTSFDSPAESQPTPGSPGPPLLVDDLWPGGIGHDAFDDMTTPLSPVSIEKLDTGLVGFLPLTKPSHPGIDTSESDIYLLVNFMENSFVRQYSLHKAPSVTQKSWLLSLMFRSPTFYNTCLSMSAYHLFLSKSCETDAREAALRNYQRHRELALQSFERLEPTTSPVRSEVIICGVHIARLEALGRNMQSCKWFLERVTKVIVEQPCLFHVGLACDPGQTEKSTSPAQYTTPAELPLRPEPTLSVPISQPSPMQLEAEVLFVSTFMWNDILCSAVEKKRPCAAGIHRRLLTDDGFASAFKAINGCEAWVMIAIMNVTLLEIQKSEQVARGNLSIRELVSQADTIEGAVDREMARISNMSPPDAPEGPGGGTVPQDLIQTLVYGHAILIFLNTVVSGALTGVPEIHQSISRAMKAWGMLPATINPKYLAWAYSTSASLATGSQRDVFRNVAARTSHLDVDTGSLREFSHGVEECWKETDKHGSGHGGVACDWREVHKRANLNILFV
ncbi:PRO1A C6 Zink-finger protein [Metarhizium album ARSEF 1941]|uniref:PRO1A C6 Zink-finger protein n=1 Tax=Metarhizium album (strain ARSEF 1941) TaxID=1081103 RepID=A0A0B2WU42_METAS|nr:PRO1A C6 Zink-finger protein [Metarhizium album ARSEF 1941]KHN99591.1 PRO1A C6 Zink-finger protein [Metarhizium album ARSEF 1941]